MVKLDRFTDFLRRAFTCSFINIRLRLVVYLCSLFVLLTLYQYLVSINLLNYSFKPVFDVSGWREKFSEDCITARARRIINIMNPSSDGLTLKDGSLCETTRVTGTAAEVIKPVSVASFSTKSTSRLNLTSTSQPALIFRPTSLPSNQSVISNNSLLNTSLPTRPSFRHRNHSVPQTNERIVVSTPRSVQNTSKLNESIQSNSRKTRCKEIPSGLQGRIAVNTKVVPFRTVEEENQNLQMGGRFSPAHCTSRNKVAIIVPYRNRPEQLKVFLRHIHPFLQRQELQYGIYVINQSGKELFNRASLINVGFVESLKDFDWECCIFHDVDLLPEDDRNLYTCPNQPRHMSVSVDKFKYKLPYKGIFGGVTALDVKQFRELNGYSNEFWGWGGEDDDMARRIKYHKLRIERYKPEIARYTMIKHKQETANKNRHSILRSAIRRYKVDGLNNLNYKLVSVVKTPIYTNITVELHHSSRKSWRKSRR